MSTRIRAGGPRGSCQVLVRLVRAAGATMWGPPYGHPDSNGKDNDYGPSLVDYVDSALNRPPRTKFTPPSAQRCHASRVRCHRNRGRGT